MTEYLNENSEVVLEIDGTLDLHQFAPKDVKTLVPDYLVECQHKGIYEVRIIHGKGKGVLRRTVHAILTRLDYVVDFRLDDKMIGNWGATVVHLKPSAEANH
ncbi:MAG: DNA mismatch repair protein MutS [Desulfobulbaceae bacterium]|nr:MAG: DNA mismatch repair protein MutS [Desulfobulbaceae bacterium]